MNALSLDETTFGELVEAPYPITSIKRLILDRSTISMDLLTNLARCMPHLKDLSLANTYGFSHSTYDDNSFWSDSDEEDGGYIDLDDSDVFGHYPDDDSDGSHPPSVADTYFGEGSLVSSFTYEGVVLDPAPLPPTDDVDAVSDASHESSDESFTLTSELEDTTEYLGEWSYDEEGKLWQLHQLCPDIVSFDFTSCKSDGVDDAMLTTICQLWGARGLQALKFGDVCQFWDSAFGAIAQYCSRTLTVLELSSRQHTPAQFALVQFDPMARVLLESCPALEVLRIDSHPIRASDIGYEPWQCSNLKELGIWIDEYEHNRDDGSRGQRASGQRPPPQTTIGLSPDIDPVTNIGLSKFRQSRPDVDIGAYMDVFDQCLRSNGLEIAPVSESAQENRDPRRRYVQKVKSTTISATHETVVRPGGRDNSEFMADVMRPRGGRSPSPTNDLNFSDRAAATNFEIYQALEVLRMDDYLIEAFKAIIGLSVAKRHGHMHDWRKVLDTTEEALAEVPADIDPARNATLLGFQLMVPHVDLQAYRDTFKYFLGCCDLELVPTGDFPQRFDLSKRYVRKKQ
ncbi:hypothetical protein BG003_007568 [Podila horticola]|nr:hypothetical protein BG003_007568 [Podila horticola]